MSLSANSRRLIFPLFRTSAIDNSDRAAPAAPGTLAWASFFSTTTSAANFPGFDKDDLPFLNATISLPGTCSPAKGSCFFSLGLSSWESSPATKAFAAIPDAIRLPERVFTHL